MTSTTTDSVTLRAAREEFRPDVVYLNTASTGLPPRRAVRDLDEAVDAWRAGRADPRTYDDAVAAARCSYARLVGVPASDVAVGSQVSVFTGLVAAALPAGAEVLVPTGEFTSLVFPFLAQAGRGVRVREVALEHLADAVTPRTALVAVSAVQSSDGALADLDSLVATGARVLLDTTQAVGWLPVDATRFAYTVCGGYKWLLGPRGTCFATVRPDAVDGLVPHAAGWYASESPWDCLYGGPLRLATTAWRFDVSPAWLAWVGQAPALDLLASVGTGPLHTHAVVLSARFRAALDLPETGSAITAVATRGDVTGLLHHAGVAASARAGRLRVAFHLNNDADDADRAAQVLAGAVLPAPTRPTRSSRSTPSPCGTGGSTPARCTGDPR